MKRFYQYMVFLCTCALIGAATVLGYRKQAPLPGQLIGGAGRAYAPAIKNFGDFMSLQGAPLSNKFNDVLSVKVVYDIHDQTLYFINSMRFRYHYDFARVSLHNEEPLGIFNTLNYGNDLQRQYILANLNCYRQSRMYTLEFSSEDQVTAQQITGLYHLIIANSYLTDSLRLLVSSENLTNMDKAGKLSLPRIYPSDIYRNQKFQALNEGCCFGILRDGRQQDANFTPGDIVVMQGTPVNVPVCAGIITNSYQTPLSHINILCHNRNIPSATQTNIFDDAAVTALFGKPVCMLVSPNGLLVSAATQKQVDSFGQLRRNVAVVALKADTTFATILPVGTFTMRQKDIVGNKAAGFGELFTISRKPSANFYVPEGAFAIPFYFYRRHISDASIRWKINDLMAMQKKNAPETEIKEQLKLIRKAIKDKPLDSSLLASVITMMKANPAYTAYRFRSSANAEDVSGFSGAGLYESKTGKLNDPEKPVDMAIKKVWASVYNENAYFERVAANIDEPTMVMGILAHRNFPDEKANGVAITRNIYRQGFTGYTVNVQIGEVPVVSPPDSVTCEQFVCMEAAAINPMDRSIATDYITFSSINGNKPVLDTRQIKALYKALNLVHRHFNSYSRHNFKNGEQPMDVEFKFDRNGRLYLKQARPYRS